MSDQPTTANPRECPEGYAPGKYLCGDGKWRPCLVGEPITEVDIIRPGWERPERTPIAHARRLHAPAVVHRLIRLRNVAFAWAGQACCAVIMHCLGVVGLETVAGAIWFPGTTLLIVWIMTQNAERSGPAAQDSANTNT